MPEICEKHEGIGPTKPPLEHAALTDVDQLKGKCRSFLVVSLENDESPAEQTTYRNLGYEQAN
jgi:hypothetical protein